MNLAAGTPGPSISPSPVRWTDRLAGFLAARHAEADDNSFLNEKVMLLIVRGRAFTAAATTCLVAGTAAMTGAAVSFGAIAALFLVLGVASAVGLLRTSAGQRPTENELFAQIVVDVGVLFAALQLVAGYDTPLDHLYFLPVVLGAYALHGRRIALLLGLILAAWTLGHNETHHGAMELPEAVEIGAHLTVGMLLGYFAHAVARLSRRHERRLAGTREREIGQLGAEATSALATRAAHTLSTPLGTMAVLVADLRQGRMGKDERDDALKLLTAEIANCKRHLSGLVEAAGMARGDGGYRADAIQLLKEIREQCLILYPEGTVRLSWPDHASAAPQVVVEMSLFNAIAGLAKDLVREPPHVAQLSADWDADGIVLRIGGSGDAEPIVRGRRRERLAVVSAILDRHGGSVLLEPGGGRRITIRLPHVPGAASR